MLKKIILLSFLFPLAAWPSIFPEPMVFDLMRGLDAKKGETEINTLLGTTFTGNDQHMLINPEIEYALADGLAVELEVPIDKKPLSSKFGVQYTITPPSSKFMLGLQGIYEPFLHERREDFSLSSVVNYRFTQRWSLVSMVGLRDATVLGKNDHYAFILNISIFYEVSDKFSVGIENDRNIYYGKEKLKALTIPQVSWKINPRIKIQSGAGLNWYNQRSVEGYLRLISEF